MTTVQAPPGYAPSALITDADALGLSEISVSSDLGTAVARYRRTARSPRATIFLHGAAGSWTTWTPLLQAADAAGADISNPILIDLPGWGDGSLTADGEAMAIEAVCSLVKDCAEELGYIEWDIVGHSMGGFIALHMAAIWPQSVLSVGVISPTAWSVIDSVDHPFRRFWLLPAFTMLWRVMQFLSSIGSAGIGLIHGVRSAGLMRWLLSPLFRHSRQIHRTVIAAFGDELRPRSFVAAARISRGYNADVMWSQIHAPVMVARGDRDVFSTMDDMTRLVSLSRHTTSTVIADCGHFAAIERPDDVLVALGYLSR